MSISVNQKRVRKTKRFWYSSKMRKQARMKTVLMGRNSFAEFNRHRGKFDKNRRKGQLTTVYGIRTYIDSLYERNTGKKARYIKGTQKFVSQRVISYKISTKICAIYLYMHKNTVSVTNNTIW